MEGEGWSLTSVRKIFYMIKYRTMPNLLLEIILRLAEKYLNGYLAQVPNVTV